MSRLFVAVRAALYATGFVVLWGWLGLSAARWDHLAGRILPGGEGPVSTEAAGVALMAVGGVLALTCAAYFVVEGKGTPAPFDAPRVFVAAGPYRFVRNPMYIGGLTVLFGFGLILRAPSVLGLAFLAALFIHLFVLFVEEPGLTHRFGESYLAYKRTTNRWIPRPRRAALLTRDGYER
jgi:protein-S-isoprenylcysteine O-methyltransferase Ste14